MQPNSFIDVNLSKAGLEQLITAVNAYGWLFEWGMFVFLLVVIGVAAWIFIDSGQKRKADRALVPRIMSLVGVFFVLPAFIFRYTGGADGVALAIRLQGEPGAPFYANPIPWNVKWLLAGYGPMLALLVLVGVAIAVLAGIIYATTVSRQRPSTEFVSALNNQFGELRQEIQSVKSRQAPPTNASTMGAGGAATVAGTNNRSAATVIERPSAAATIIDRGGVGAAELRAVQGPTSGRTWKLPAGEAKIGRDASNLVAIEDAKASREHARVRFADGLMSITDLGSSNGTYVNDSRISGQVPLSDGDLIRIGDTVLAFSMPKA